MVPLNFHDFVPSVVRSHDLHVLEVLLEYVLEGLLELHVLDTPHLQVNTTQRLTEIASLLFLD